MGPLFAFLLCIFALCSTTPLENHGLHFTIGKEVVYDYESHVKVQTDQPVSYASLYGLKAKVYIQRNEANTVMVRLDNIAFELENGPIRVDDTQDVYVPIPTEAESLKLPFAIKYDSNGLVIAVIVDSNDKEWSYNIKKSIASIFQFNQELMSTFDRKVSHVEYSKEQTVYGVCNITYDVLPREDNVMVVKTVDPRQCENNYNLKRSVNFLDVDSNRVYKINQKDNKGRLEMIVARGDIIFAPHKATSEMTVLKVLQKFTFVQEVAITNPLTISNQLALRSLKYEDPLYKCRDTPVNALVDITGGRVQHNTEVLVPKVHAWLGQFVNLIRENHLTLTKPNSKMIQLLQSLLAVLENFDLSTLEHTFVLLQEQSQNAPNEQHNINLFVQLLPHVGTRSSAVFIRNLIRKQKIDESMAVRVLRDLPAHVRCPNEKLLIELEDLLTISESGSRIHRASVLAFASLIKRSFIGIDEKSPGLDKYIKLFMQKIQSSQDYNIQVLYVHALGNIGIESVIDTLAPILTGEIETERNLRSLALWSVAPLLQKNPSLMIKYVWPILSDRKLDISLRTAAYDIFVRTENPTLNRFMQLYWLMRFETNERFYNFHYNTMVTNSQSRYSSNDESRLKEICLAILRMSHYPIVKYETEGIFKNDFYDEKSGLGAQIDNLVSRGSHINIRPRVVSRIYGFETEMLSLHLGIAVPNLANIKSKQPLTNYLELVIRQQGRVVMTYVEDKPNMQTFFDIAKDLGLNIAMNEDNKILEIPYLYGRVIPTDFGVPVRMMEMLPQMESIYVKMDSNLEEDIKFEFQIKSMVLHNLGINVYNPINNLWHGIETNKHINFQFGFSVSFEDAPKAYKIIINKINTDFVNGLQVHNEYLAFIKGAYAEELLGKCHKDSLVRSPIIRGEDYTTNTVVYDREIKTLGHHLQVNIFDCDRDLSSGTLLTRLEEMDTGDDRSDFMSIEFLRLYLTMLFPSGYGTCGYGARFTPLETFDHIEFDVVMSVQKDFNEPNGYLRPFGFEVTVQGATKSVKNTNLATYNSKLNVTVSGQQRNLALKWWIVHNDQVNKENKLDVDLHYEMKEDHLDSKLIVSLGEVDNLGVITFDVKGTRSEEQERILSKRKITYNECRPQIVHGKYLTPVSVECAIAHSNLNRYAIDVTVNDVQNRMVQMFLSLFNTVRYEYIMYGHRKSKADTKVVPIHLDVVYPVFRKEWDVTVDTPRYTEVYTGIPQSTGLQQWSYWSLEDLSLSNVFFTVADWNSVERVTSLEQCVISKDHVLTLNGNIQNYELTNEWISYLNASSDEGELYNVYVKNVAGSRPVAIQVKIGTDVIEIIPQEHECSIKVNNKVVTPVVGKYTEDTLWNYLMVESPKMIMFSTRVHGLHVIYDGRTIRTMTPPSHKRYNFNGHCVESQEKNHDFEMSKTGVVHQFFSAQ